MTQRQLDRALLAGIGVILLVILGLALSPAPTTARGDISDPAVRTPQVDVLPASPPDAAVLADSREGELESTDSEPAVVENDSAADTEEGSPVETAPPPTDEPTARTPFQPVAGVPVERVGFAYATGSEGACGVPLTAWSYVAVSRDLLEAYPCGTAVTLSFEDEIAGRSSVTAQVGDTMGADITDTVNVFVGEDEPALEYGVTSGTLAQ